jgi:hypothetical protein
MMMMMVVVVVEVVVRRMRMPKPVRFHYPLMLVHPLLMRRRLRKHGATATTTN